MFEWLKRTHTILIFGPTGRTTINMKVWRWSWPEITSTSFERTKMKGGHMSAFIVDERTQVTYVREEG